MSKRQYAQVCALSQALDMIGDRWTMLVLRELVFGARRYSDLLRELPGLGTNLLAQRLKELEGADLIERKQLPPPAASRVYMMTKQGRSQIMPIIRTLTDFGVAYLQYPPPEGYFVPASSTMGALSKFFRPERAEDFSVRVQFCTEADVFGCVIEAGEMTWLSFGELPDADLRLQAQTDVFMGLIVGYKHVAEVVETAVLKIEKGTTKLASTFFNLFEQI